MDIRDFEGCAALKCILPVIYTLHILMMLTFPFLFPLPYQIYNFTLMAYLTIRSLLTLTYSLIAAKKTHSLLNSRSAPSQLSINSSSKCKELSSNTTLPLLASKPSQMSANGQQAMREQARREQAGVRTVKQLQCYHAFIVPNYKEELSILTDTLTQISKHPQATSRFLVFLAMEAHEPESQAKAQQLIDSFQHCFLHIKYTTHVMRQHEQKGKAANVSWCAEHIQEDFLLPLKIDPSAVMLTVIDADSWIPPLYIDEVDRQLRKRHEERHSLIFEPCQMFTLNHWEVPLMTRTYDLTHGLVHFSNLFSLFNTSFPLSNYSLSYFLAKRIGFWDTCPDAIGEDFHTTIKAFWKTKGNIKTISIFTPFNQLNINTGKGYWADCCARFWQAQRHGRGCADAAYCLNRLRKQGLTWRTFLVMYQVIQITTMPAVLPWGMFAGILMGNNPGLSPVLAIVGFWLSVTCTVCFLVSMWSYLGVCQRASRELYSLRNFSKGRVRWRGQVRLECMLMFIPNIFLVTVPSATIAAFRVAFFNNQYEVAQKKAASSQ